MNTEHKQGDKKKKKKERKERNADYERQSGAKLNLNALPALPFLSVRWRSSQFVARRRGAAPKILLARRFVGGFPFLASSHALLLAPLSWDARWQKRRRRSFVQSRSTEMRRNGRRRA